MDEPPLSGAIPLLPLYAFMAWTEITLRFSLKSLIPSTDTFVLGCIKVGNGY